MSTIKLVLFKGKKYSDDSHPIVLQFTEGGKVKRKVIHRCKLKDWDTKAERLKPKAPNAAYVNNFLSETFADAEKQLFKIKQGEASTISYFEGTTNMTVGDAIAKERARLVSLLKPTPEAQLRTYHDQLGKLVTVGIDKVDINWFNKAIDIFRLLGNEPATLEKKIKHLRRLLAKYSVKEFSKEVKGLKITITKPLKQKLTADELDRISALTLPVGSNISVTRDIFLLQIYLRGVRIGDILQAYSSQFDNGRFTYKSDKTGKDMTIKLVPAAVEIITKYLGRHQRLFPLFSWSDIPGLSKFENEKKRLKHKESCTAIVNSNLKKIAVLAEVNKPLSSHIARHTFARMAIDKINNPMITMELLGHSSLAVHQAYLNDLRKDDVLDAAADDIFG